MTEQGAGKWTPERLPLMIVGLGMELRRINSPPDWSSGMRRSIVPDGPEPGGIGTRAGCGLRVLYSSAVLSSSSQRYLWR